LKTPGIQYAVAFAGFSGATRATSPNGGAIFVGPKPFDERRRGPTADQLLETLQHRLAEIEEAEIFVIPPPPVQGLGTSGGFKLYVQDRSGHGFRALQEATDAYVSATHTDPEVSDVFTSFRASGPQLYANIDRVKAEKLSVPPGNVFDALQTYLGSVYVNDFNRFGRQWKVFLQAEPEYRRQAEDLGAFYVRNTGGAMVPLSTLITSRDAQGPEFTTRFNLYRAA
jgi:multidrug efflux pump subunit AcrB